MPHKEEFRVLPTLKCNIINSNKVQLRFPNSQCLTIKYDSKTISKILSYQGIQNKDAWIKHMKKSGANNPDQLFELFTNTGTFCINENNATSEMIDANLLHESHQTYLVRNTVLDIPHFKTIQIIGKGELFSLCIENLKNYTQIKASYTTPDIVLICSDTDNIDYLKNQWNASYNSQLKLVFWCDNEMLHLGPVHIRDESACFECYLKRSLASSHFREEMLSFNRNGDTRIHKIALGLCIESLATYIFLRTLRLIYLKQFHILKPGLLESWVINNGSYSNKVVLRNTFCNCCSKNVPKRAIRNMI
ncbi:hypothetical protein EXT00_02180 [Helicobacter pylori]|uniref:hypothetical protein n=1 Tax=Helicobacter pylori TaxID=210 RepID=UPI0013F3D18A|nr:hypothetical protein [Helicobacter pylori]NHB25838.1 hypothetical protein [Helicobacter pylori]